jgi:site-specific recombinase XerD
MITRANWRERMESDMRLRDLRPRTIEGYLLAIRLFIERVDKEPEKLKEEDVRTYVLHLRDDRHQAPSSINIAICALRFFFNCTCSPAPVVTGPCGVWYLPHMRREPRIHRGCCGAD